MTNKIEEKLEAGVERVLKTNTVKGAVEVLRSKSGTGFIFAVSFLESSLPLPILTDPFLVAAILVERKNAVRLILATTIASVMGGLFAYFAAAFFIDVILGWLSVGMVNEFNHLVNGNNSSTFMLTLVGAVTPVPYTIAAWVVAVLQGSVWTFILASFLGRGFRYLVVGWCTYQFGPTAMHYAKKYIGITSIILFILAALFVWLKI